MDVDTRALVGPLRHHAGKELNSGPVKTMRQSLDRESINTGVRKKNLINAPSSGIALKGSSKISGDDFSQTRQ